MGRPPDDDARMWRPAGLDGVEALAARYTRHHFPPHRHEAVLVGVIEDGAHAVTCRGSRYVAGPGTVATIDAGEVHHGGAAAEGGWRQRMLYVPEASLAELAEDALDRPAPPAALHFRETFRRDLEVVRAYRAMHALLDRGGEPLELQGRFEGVLRAVLARFGGLRAPPPPAPGRLGVERAREYLHAHLASPCPLSELARVAGLRRRHLVAAFRARYGLPPHRYLTQIRVDAARALLARGLPPGQVAAAVGFADQSHLVRRFKAVVGATPGRYRAGETRTFYTDPGPRS